ncbi:PREDICTED: endonuclease III-like protein 1 [Ceratosolen solmsi marchali]|uniref:Endonuclease III homolog n=1 Tax=Ceratosolen solmsi marchali TaxID=326594 RepID=A0AAJ7DT91_9HYME|nr:PREDICTED: endonuclease III-like protein 1 [Ceratosolen solmsi marchali]
MDFSDIEKSKFFKNEKNLKKNSNHQTIIKTKKKNSKSINSSNFECDNTVNVDNIQINNIKSTFSKWSPSNWKKHLNNIKEMRRNYTAPVDRMGCQKCADESESGPVFRFQTLIALMLSSQTRDQITHNAMQRLKECRCTPEYIISISDEELGKLIFPVSFWKRKVQYLKKTSKIVLEKYNGDIPTNIHELSNLPGVGPKMAHICMNIAWNKISGIGVDTHVHRISNRLKWVPKPTKSPEETRLALESWLPKELWRDINYLFVGFGQEICRSQQPRCLQCLNKSICCYNNQYQF